MKFAKRQMLLIPELNPRSFVFFFERGNSRTSWSIRDYSIADAVRVYRPGDFPWTADDILNKARYAVNAPTRHTERVEFWHKHTIKLNNEYGVNMAASHPASPGDRLVRDSSALQKTTFFKAAFRSSILNLQKLLSFLCQKAASLRTWIEILTRSTAKIGSPGNSSRFCSNKIRSSDGVISQVQDGGGIRTRFELAGRGVANQDSVAVTVDGRGNAT
jgi:hypothetical protein